MGLIALSALLCSARPACGMYNALVNRLATSANNNGNPPSKPNTGPMPWLYYAGDSYIEATDVDLKYVSVAGRCSEVYLQQACMNVWPACRALLYMKVRRNNHRQEQERRWHCLYTVASMPDLHFRV
eukprot:365253-Chlamydomonas_euryale.AAC.10